MINLISGTSGRRGLIARAARLPSIQLSIRSEFDLEMIATGGFSPLDRFMGRDDYLSVVETMRLADGTLFPIPITLPVNDDVDIAPGVEVALRSVKFELLGTMEIEEVFEWDLQREALMVAGTTDSSHSLVAEMHSWGKRYVSGRLEVFDLPKRFDFRALRLTPSETRSKLAEMDNSNVVAFQTRNPMHRAHEELTKRAADSIDATLLMHPVVGKSKPGDVDHYTRVRCYKALYDRYYDKSKTLLSLVPLSMRMAGPRGALWHAIIRRNYGANYFVVGRDHASPGKSSKGIPFYGPYEAQELISRYADETGVIPYLSQELVYLPDRQEYVEANSINNGQKTLAISGTEVRNEYLYKGVSLPEWYSRPEVAKILRSVYPPKQKQGFCIWFTGLSGAGKSTIAEVLIDLLAESGRKVTTLDGDVVRTHLTKGLGFSKQDRDTNIRRIGFVASEIVKHNGAVMCAAISPYKSTRDEVSKMIGDDKFILVYVNTPIEICEERDSKGLYAKARRGEITGFTGVDDPYEAPENPDLSLDTVNNTPAQNAALIVDYIRECGFLGGFENP